MGELLAVSGWVVLMMLLLGMTILGMLAWSLFLWRSRPQDAPAWNKSSSSPPPAVDGDGKALDRRVLEEALQLWRLIDNVPVAIFQYAQFPDDQRTGFYISRGCTQIWELSPEELRQDPDRAWGMTHPDDVEMLTASIDHSMQNLSQWRCEFRVIPPSGTVKWLQGFGIPSHREDGSTLWHSMVMDISERKEMEVALRRNEEKFASILNTMPGIVYQYIQQPGGKGQLIFVNQAIEEIYGIPVQEVQENPAMLWETVLPEDLPKLQSGLDQIAQGPSVHNSLFRVRTRSGDLKWMQSSFTPHFGEKGETILDGVLIDITQHKQAEEALEESDRRLSQALRAARAGAWEWNIQTNQTYWSDGNYEILGLSPDRHKDSYTAWFERVHPEDRERVTRLVSQAVEERSGINFEYRAVLPSGEERWIADIGETVLDEAGDPAFMYGIQIDVTDRYKAERDRERLLRQVQRQAQQLQQILDTVPEGVMVLNQADEIILANPVALKDLAALAGVGVGERLIRLGDRQLAELLNQDPASPRIELHHQERIFEITTRSMQEEGEESAKGTGQWVIVFSDITQERQHQVYRQAQERLATVGQLAAGIAHDFNNIMNVVTLYAQMLQRTEELSDRGLQQLRTIHEQAGHAARLTQQILDFSRRSVMEQVTVDLSALLTESVSLFRRTLPENIRICFETNGRPHLVNADLTRLQQVLLNLAINARDAMPQGGELIFSLHEHAITAESQKLRPEIVPGPWVEIRIADTGMGIPAENMRRIFDPFFTTKPVGMGSGLGLAQVHGIIAQHGGAVFVESAPNQGTTFQIFLPAAPASATQLEEDPQLQLAPGQGERLLVVEDQATMRLALVDSLCELGYDVTSAVNGLDALAQMEEAAQPFDLILSDVVMPEMGGLDLLRTLRNRHNPIPVLLISGHPMYEEITPELREAFQGWITKPVTIEQLAQAVSEALAACLLNNPG
jgi:PAS domain S-box-containing protein